MTLYFDVTAAGHALQLYGPSPLAGGVTKWLLLPVTGKMPDCVSAATLYAGPLNALPIAARLQAARITSTAEYSLYGVIDTVFGSNCPPGSTRAGSLIGLSGIGNVVQLSTFTTILGVDQNMPIGTLTLARQSP